MAQGGLQLPDATPDAQRRFVDDMLRSARVPVEEKLVYDFAARVPDCVEKLEGWGLDLDRTADGELRRRRAGGLSDARIVTCRDEIGPALMKVLQEQLESLAIPIETHSRVRTLHPRERDVVVEIDARDGEARSVCARSVVVATGGITYEIATRRHEPTSNPRNDNHVLYQALSTMGLPRVHEEFFQYQPFGLISFDHGAVGRCVPESIVNFDVQLVDRDGDQVVDLRRDRLTVARAMRATIDRGEGFVGAHGRHGLCLTLSKISVDELGAAFPKLAALLSREGRLGDDVLVEPFLHYQLGGFRTALNGETVYPHLFLAGEMTGGLHGMNRLMGNGITESLVRGQLAGEAASR
jgi:succinate dehydrogenase / fumarate reductase flavoprotein subunit/L-aspartate oxidase